MRNIFQYLTIGGLSVPLVLFGATANASHEQGEQTSDLVRSCSTCHGDGDAAIPGWPPLKTLSKAELVSKLTTYRNQLVPESRMSDVTHHFSDEEIRQIADYFSQHPQ